MNTLHLSLLNRPGKRRSWSRAWRRSPLSMTALFAGVVMAAVIAAAVILFATLGWSRSASADTKLQTSLAPASATEVDPFAVQKANAPTEELPAQF